MTKTVERKRIKVTTKTTGNKVTNKGSGQAQGQNQSVKINIRIGDSADTIKKKKKEQDKKKRKKKSNKIKKLLITQIQEILAIIEQLKQSAAEKKIQIPTELIALPTEIPSSVKNLNILLEDLKLKAQKIDELINKPIEITQPIQQPIFGNGGNFSSEIDTQQALLRSQEIIRKSQFTVPIDPVVPVVSLPPVVKNIINNQGSIDKNAERELEKIANEQKLALKKKAREDFDTQEQLDAELKKIQDEQDAKEKKEDLAAIGQADLNIVKGLQTKIDDYNKNIQKLAKKMYSDIEIGNNNFNLKENKFKKYKPDKDQLINIHDFNKDAIATFIKNKGRIIAENPQVFQKLKSENYNKSVDEFLNETIIGLGKNDKRDLNVDEIISIGTDVERDAKNRSIKMNLNEFDKILDNRVKIIEQERKNKIFTPNNRESSIRIFNEIVEIGNQNKDIYSEWLSESDNKSNLEILEQFNIDSKNRTTGTKIDSAIESAYNQVKIYLSKTDNKFTTKDFKPFKKLGMSKPQWELRIKQSNKINALQEWVQMWVNDNPEYESSLEIGKLYDVTKDPILIDQDPRGQDPMVNLLREKNKNNNIIKSYIESKKDINGKLSGNFTPTIKQAVKDLYGIEFFDSLPTNKKKKKERDDIITNKYFEENPNTTITPINQGTVSVGGGMIAPVVLGDDARPNPSASPPQGTVSVGGGVIAGSVLGSDAPSFALVNDDEWVQTGSAFRRGFQKKPTIQSFKK